MAKKKRRQTERLRMKIREGWLAKDRKEKRKPMKGYRK